MARRGARGLLAGASRLVAVHPSRCTTRKQHLLARCVKSLQSSPSQLFADSQDTKARFILQTSSLRGTSLSFPRKRS